MASKYLILYLFVGIKFAEVVRVSRSCLLNFLCAPLFLVTWIKTVGVIFIYLFLIKLSKAQ